VKVMDAGEYIEELNLQMSYLYTFARQINELDFAGSLTGEFRGAQDAGWTTTITAHQVHDELIDFSSNEPRSVAEFRVILMLYCQLSEAGGVYECLKNLMGIFTLQPYNLWPFKDLVRVKNEPRRIIGPNANSTFRDLAAQAKAIGLSELSSLLEIAFRDDIRNGISYADYVIWNDGLRLRKRNGGFAAKLSFDEVNDALTKGIGFFEVLRGLTDYSVKSFDPPRKIVGTFSANNSGEHIVAYDPHRGSFSISGSSPGLVTSPEYIRQTEINARLGGKALAMFLVRADEASTALETHIAARGFEPNLVELSIAGMDRLRHEVDQLALWDERLPDTTDAGSLILTPWGFRWVYTPQHFDDLLPKPLNTVKVE
jgi:hypothetical protein